VPVRKLKCKSRMDQSLEVSKIRAKKNKKGFLEGGVHPPRLCLSLPLSIAIY
jgi:hypothetical protein